MSRGFSDIFIKSQLSLYNLDLLARETDRASRELTSRLRLSSSGEYKVESLGINVPLTYANGFDDERFMWSTVKNRLYHRLTPDGE